ncbi:HepT-like ribonuclease domain-containing protein [Sulfurimonas sediminis]|nr:HepT-like ribonuclease domain-containing protein [Sulfurimonas sediminis]
MSKASYRLQTIFQAIEDIEYITTTDELKVTKAIENRLIKPAIRMNIVRIAEQFNKLKDDNAFKILEQFDPDDLRGINAVRNYIAHDYDSTDDHIIEDVIRYNIPVLKKIVLELLIKEKENEL